MRPVKVHSYMQPSVRMAAIEGWVVMVTTNEKGALVEKLLVREGSDVLTGIIVADCDDAIRLNFVAGSDNVLAFSIDTPPPDGLHVVGVRVELDQIGGLWLSELPNAEEQEFVMVPFKGEAIALLDEKDRWWVPWAALLPNAVSQAHCPQILAA